MLSNAFFYLGFVTTAFTNFNFVALSVIVTVMAMLYIQVTDKYNRTNDTCNHFLDGAQD
ncbi:hypothetical protein [Candidatus Pantoea carbekii]|uniref:hypothetical protein n=1 Tax=Candidatus Pantoea carbekii TaxID=1235990 RepID=UPI0004B745F1|nr:hypothetical protein [Candidatus Pantoea carbekii]